MYDVKDFIKPFKKKREKPFYWAFYNFKNDVLKYILLDKKTSESTNLQILKWLLRNLHKLSCHI